jgi:GTPase
MKAGFVALIGLPNVGKSTLLNAVIGEKVSIGSSKPQTTRQRVTGILSTKEFQAVFVDAPGVLHRASSELNQFLIDEYRDVLAQSDGALAIISAEPELFEDQKRILELVRQSGKPYAVVVTKGDLGKPETFEAIKELSKEAKGAAVSALKNPREAAEIVRDLVDGLLPDSPAPLYDVDIYSTASVRQLAAETVREKCFENLAQELPYGLAVKVNQFKEEDKITRIQTDIIVGKDSHKAMVIGKGGLMLKKIGTDARKDLEKLLGTKVFLEMFVSVKPEWMKNRRMMEELGYVIERQ